MPIVWLACLTLGASPAPAALPESCGECHPVTIDGGHRDLACSACHGEGREIADPSAGGRGCVSCHGGYAKIFSGPMSRRLGERAFVEATYAKRDPEFFAKNCGSCHLGSCGDCHGSGHALHAPTTDDCIGCHKGYFVGADYLGLAPRENSLRYQRGIGGGGERYLQMAPDVHKEAGMGCPDCHTMESLVMGRSSAMSCRDCHDSARGIVEHDVEAHLSGLECYACHSAWAPQEYGTFWMRFVESPLKRHFALKPGPNEEYLEGVYLRKQDSPPLGLNERGLVSPIRPEFIAYFTHVEKSRTVGEENELLAQRWKAYFPHSVRRGTVLCDACHGNSRRFMLERKKDRIHDLQADGLGFDSFWDRKGQEVVNGTFLPQERFEEMSARSPSYKRAYVERWNQLLDRVGRSSGN